MEKEVLIKLIDENLSIREMKSVTGKGYSTVRYWLKKYDLKTNNNLHNTINYESGKKVCNRCGELKNIEDFYKRTKNSEYIQSVCKTCSKKYHSKRIKEVKIRMINYKGGECERCHLKLEDSHYCVFDLHHNVPSEKHEKFKKIKFQKWEVIKEEIDKCMLLCSNCHRLTHAEIEEW